MFLVVGETITSRTNIIKVQNFRESIIFRFINHYITVLQETLLKSLKPTDTDLFNLSGEILGELNNLLYL